MISSSFRISGGACISSHFPAHAGRDKIKNEVMIFEQIFGLLGEDRYKLERVTLRVFRIAERSRQMANPNSRAGTISVATISPRTALTVPLEFACSLLIIRARTGATNHQPRGSLDCPDILTASCRQNRLTSNGCTTSA